MKNNKPSHLETDDVNNPKYSDFYKENESNTIWWLDNLDSIGEHLFTFDKKKIYNLFADYPHNMTAEEVEIFDKENPYWADFFKDRRK